MAQNMFDRGRIPSNLELKLRFPAPTPPPLPPVEREIIFPGNGHSLISEV